MGNFFLLVSESVLFLFLDKVVGVETVFFKCVALCSTTSDQPSTKLLIIFVVVAFLVI